MHLFCKKVITETAKYDKVFLIHWDDSEYQNNLYDQINQISKDTTHTQKIAILLGRQEPMYYVPTAQLPLQIINLMQCLKQNSLFALDLFFTDWMCDCYDGTFVNFVEQNGHRCHVIDLNFPVAPFDIGLQQSTDPQINKISYNISHANMAFRMHRELFSKFLIKNELHKSQVVAINDKKSKLFAKNCIGDGNDVDNLMITHPLLYRDEWPYSQGLKDLWRDVPLVLHRHDSITKPEPDNESNHDSTDKPFILTAGVNIVSETVFDYPKKFITEKTMQAILNNRPFVIIGPSGTLEYLRSKGLKTFDHIFDESYDLIQDPNQRLEAIMNLVKKISAYPISDIKQMVSKATDVILHNHDKIVTLRKNLNKQAKDCIIRICQ